MKCYMNNEGERNKKYRTYFYANIHRPVEISCIKIHTLLLPAWLYIICRYIVLCIYTSRTVCTECLQKLRKYNLGKTHLSKTTRSPFLMVFSIKMLLDTTTSGFTEPLCILRLSFQKSLSSRIQILAGNT